MSKKLKVVVLIHYTVDITIQDSEYELGNEHAFAYARKRGMKEYEKYKLDSDGYGEYIVTNVVVRG